MDRIWRGVGKGKRRIKIDFWVSMEIVVSLIEIGKTGREVGLEGREN